MKATIWHNPRCGTSRNTLALLEEAGVEVTIFDYLKAPLSAEELRRIYAKAGISAREGLRSREPGAEALADASEEQVIAAMLRDPILIQRPLVETEKGAVLARPPELVRDIL